MGNQVRAGEEEAREEGPGRRGQGERDRFNSV